MFIPPYWIISNNFDFDKISGRASNLNWTRSRSKEWTSTSTLIKISIMKYAEYRVSRRTRSGLGGHGGT